MGKRTGNFPTCTSTKVTVRQRRDVAASLRRLAPHYYPVGFAVRRQSTVQYVRISFCPENVEKCSSSPQNESELSRIHTSRNVSRFYRGPIAGSHPHHVFELAGSRTITIAHRKEKSQSVVHRIQKELKK